jgi:hypothetical protein
MQELEVETTTQKGEYRNICNILINIDSIFFLAEKSSLTNTIECCVNNYF